MLVVNNLQGSLKAGKPRVDKQGIRAAVSSVEAGISRKIICEQYGVALSTLDGWMRLYGSAHYQAHKRRAFSPQQKRNIVRAITEDRLNVKEAAVANSIPVDTVRSWIRTINRENTELAVLNRSVMDQQRPATPAQDLKTLQQQLQEAQLKIAALETMIEIAEKQYKIEIRKKPGAKQSPK
jgi:transposase